VYWLSFFLEELADVCAALGHDKAQNIIDQITSAYESGGGPPQGGFGFGPQHLGAPPPAFGGPPTAFGPPPPGFGGRKYISQSERIRVNSHNVAGPPGPPFSGPGYPLMMPPGVPPFPPNGVPPGMGFPPPFPPPPGGTMPPFAPQNLAPTSLQMDRGSNMDISREGDIAVRTNGDANGDSSSSYPTSQPVPPTIHPDRLRMMGNGTRP
jgi:U1 small nuclear ribonucleoprotein C